MRILVHDYAGHPFQAQLSRALARRGHTVRHAYCASLQTTPLSVAERPGADADTFEIADLRLAQPLEKYAYFRRWRQENAYGRLVAAEVDRFRPDVVLSGNTPLDAQRLLLRRCRARDVRFVFWVQDLIGVASERLLRKAIPGLGAFIGSYYARLERRLLRQSDQVVLITDDFRPLLRRWAVPEAKMHTIENWAPLEDLPVRPKQNPWSRRHGLENRCCLMYTGTMGMKHNPDVLLRLALHLRDRPDPAGRGQAVCVVVVSQGLGADWLRQRKDEFDLDNLLVLPFAPFSDLPDVMATADVLLAVLEPDAGVFSVPSKVLAYFCAARPMVLAVPPENLAARLVRERGAGLVVSPSDAEGFVEAATSLLDAPARRAQLGRSARAYAEEAFDIQSIADAFEDVLEQACTDA
ncbi:MAG: glycosyltransferase family 4 protein [Rhodothermales bacterium]